MGAEATWTSLMAKHEGSKEVLVAHIDCGEPSYEMGEFLATDFLKHEVNVYGFELFFLHISHS